jgi:hypothetical protein
MFGISDGYYKSVDGKILFGTGQGSGASPAAWLTISIVLLASLHTLIDRGMLFKTPDGTTTVERYSDAFVDDAQNGLNNAHQATPWTISDLSRCLAHMSQTWEKLLFSSGGALELSKCFYYIVYWKWVDGLPGISHWCSWSPVSPKRQEFLGSNPAWCTGFSPEKDQIQHDPNLRRLVQALICTG